MYIVIEIQTGADGVVGTIVNQYANLNDAESKFHTVLATASVSEVPFHTAMIITNEGVTVRAECYKHANGSTIHEIPSM